MPLCDEERAVITDDGQEGGDFSVDLMDAKLLKQEVFPCLSRDTNAFRVFLTSTEIILQSLRQNEDIERFKLEDLFGVHTLKHTKKKTENAAYLCFYLYPKSRRSGILTSVKYRERIPLVFLVQKAGRTFDENLAYAQQWKDEALKILRQKFPKWHHTSTSSARKLYGTMINGTLVDSNNPNSNITYLSKSNHRDMVADVSDDLSVALSSFHLFQRRYLVILNPKSGQGKTISMYRTQVAPILQEAGIKPELFITQHAGHANSLVSTSDFNDIHGILTVGGDGLLYEVVNGLRLRPDADRIANSCPCSPIATGSGNGLARSIAAYTGESADYIKNPVLSTTLAAARGKILPVNLTEVDLDGKKVYSFLSAGWGLLADIDVESECLRRIGESRFTIWSFLRLAKLRSYKARLSYIPSTDHSGHTMPSVDIPEDSSKRIHIDGSFLCVYSACQSYIGSDLKFAPSATPNDNVIHLTYISGNAGRVSATQFLLGLDKGSHLNVSGVKYLTVKEFSIHSAGGIDADGCEKLQLPQMFTLDGERVTAQNLTVRICPRPLNVFSL